MGLVAHCLGRSGCFRGTMNLARNSRVIPWTTMTTHGEHYPPTGMSSQIHDLLAVYIQLDLLIRRLVGTRMEHGPDERRDALLARLVDAQKLLERSGVWN